jgi:hypothetical protein
MDVDDFFETSETESNRFITKTKEHRKIEGVAKYINRELNDKEQKSKDN